MDYEMLEKITHSRLVDLREECYYHEDMTQPQLYLLSKSERYRKWIWFQWKAYQGKKICIRSMTDIMIDTTVSLPEGNKTRYFGAMREKYPFQLKDVRVFQSMPDLILFFRYLTLIVSIIYLCFIRKGGYTPRIA